MAPADTRSTTDALAAMAKSIEDIAVRNQQNIDDLSARTQQTFIEFSTRTQALETLVQRQGEENAKAAANVERMMTNFMTQLQGVVQEAKPGASHHGKHVVPSSETSQPRLEPLLPTPAGSNIEKQPQQLYGVNNNVKTPRIDVPIFSGEDVEAWLFQLERFFDHNLIPTDQRLTLATFYMGGEALKWYQWLYSTHQLSNWSNFVQDLKARFGPSSYWDAEVELNKLQQTSSVSLYITEFESLSTKTPSLTPNNLLKRFLAGLKEEIHREIVLFHPRNLQVAMGMARVAEQKLNSNRSWNTRPPSNRVTSNFVGNTVDDKRPTKAQQSSSATPLPVRKLTVSEMAARREKGLCFNSDEKFTPGHRCEPRFQCLILEESALEDEAFDTIEPSEVDTLTKEEKNTIIGDTLTISFHALEGRHVPQTLKIEGMMHGKRIAVLIDTGSTHNFLQSRIARHVGLSVEKAENLNVTVGNGDELQCAGACKDVELRLGNTLFQVNFYLLPIYGADAVLGAQWLAELGDITFNYKALTMRFEHMGKGVQLEGLNQNGA